MRINSTCQIPMEVILKPRIEGSPMEGSESLPTEFLDMIKDVFLRQYREFFAGKELIVLGEVYAEEAQLLVGFRENGSIRQMNFEASIDLSKEASATERIHLCTEALGDMISEYIAHGGDVEFPLTWKEFPVEKDMIYLKVSRDNTELDAQADEFLKQAEDAMILESCTDLH